MQERTGWYNGLQGEEGGAGTSAPRSSRGPVAMSAGTGAPLSPQDMASPTMRGSGGADFFSAWALSNHTNLGEMAPNPAPGRA